VTTLNNYIIEIVISENSRCGELFYTLDKRRYVFADMMRQSEHKLGCRVSPAVLHKYTLDTYGELYNTLNYHSTISHRKYIINLSKNAKTQRD
jgi:hypothetical protein